MLYEIESPPTARNSVILLHPRDNVAVARVALSGDQCLEVNGVPISIRQPVPAGHKLAIKPVRTGEPVYRYGNVIGFATAPIEAGDHVHVHNLGYKELDASDIVPGEGSEIHLPHVAPRTFLGFQRADGRVGTRNYIAVVAASNCAAHASELIAQSFADEVLPPNVDGVVAFPHGEGCGQAIGPDTDQLERTLKGVLDHPNVSAALILGLGCEVNQIGHYLGNGSASNIPAALQGLTLQDSGGTLGAVEAARKQVRQYIERAAGDCRVEVPASKIVLGLNCGGSDSFSGITANPALGYCCDLIVEQGGTIVLAETTEIFGAEHLLVRRARNPETARKLLDCVARYKTYLRQFGKL